MKLMTLMNSTPSTHSPLRQFIGLLGWIGLCFSAAASAVFVSTDGWYAALPGSLLAMVLGPLLGLGLGDLILGQQSADWLSLKTLGGRLTLIFSVFGTLVSLVVIGSIDEDKQASMARTADRKFSIAERGLRRAVDKFGMDPADILFDPLVLPISTGMESDRRSALELIDGTVVDFVREGLNEAFRFRNPRAKGECGCGESFTV